MVKVSRENQQVIEKNLSNQNKGRKKTFKFCNQQGDGYVSWCDIWSVRIQPVALTHHFLLLRRAPAPRTSLCGCALNQLGKVTAFTKNICLGECCYVFISRPMGSWMRAQPVGSRAAQGARRCTRTSPPRESQPGCWMLAVTKTLPALSTGCALGADCSQLTTRLLPGNSAPAALAIARSLLLPPAQQMYWRLLFVSV